MRKKRCVVFQSEQYNLFGIYHPPKSEKKCPAIIVCHGFGGTKVGRHRIYVELANRLAEQGIATLRFDFRGSGDSDGDYQALSISGEVKDACSAVDFLKAQPEVDGERLGILGCSLGGAIAIQTAHRLKTLKSLVTWAPVFNTEDFVSLWKAHPDNRPDNKGMIRFMGEVTNMHFVEQFLALHVQEDLMTMGHLPLLLLQGEKDALLGSSHFERYRACRQSAEAESKFVKLKNSDHEFGDVEERQVLVNETTEWFQKTL